MLSSARLAPEEFDDSDSPSRPRPTVLVSRSRALRLLESCELAEMTPSPGFLDFVVGGGGFDPKSSDATDAAGGRGRGDGEGPAGPHALVAQMALLLRLGEYGHARHLWRRRRDDFQVGGGGDDDERAQLERLWDAAGHCCRWNSAGSGVGVVGVDDGTRPEGRAPPLPPSTLALRALGSCAVSGAEPLATYAAELSGLFRSRVNRVLRDRFDGIGRDEFLLRMDLPGQADDDGAGGGEEGRIWEDHGWREEGEYLIPDMDAELDDEEEDSLAGGEKEGDRIGKLTDIVMFLEGKMNA